VVICPSSNEVCTALQNRASAYIPRLVLRVFLSFWSTARIALRVLRTSVSDEDADLTPAATAASEDDDALVCRTLGDLVSSATYPAINVYFIAVFHRNISRGICSVLCPVYFPHKAHNVMSRFYGVITCINMLVC